MRKRLTKRAVDAAQPGARPRFLWDTDVTGFGLKVTPPGRKIFVFQYRLRGLGRRAAPKRITLGRYGELTPDQARKRAADIEYRQLPAEAVAVLETIPKVAGCPYVFPGRDLKLHLTTVKRPWERIRSRAGLDNLEGLGPLRLHDLRHNVVSWDVSRGVPLEIAGRNVGHRSRRSTEVYAHFAPDALKRAADERAEAMRKAIRDSDRLDHLPRIP